MENKYKNIKLAEHGAQISIIAYISLSLLKLIIGYLSNSKALTADGLNNTTDIIASLAVFIGLRIARKPADDDHRYGHWRSETVSSLIASLIMLTVGLDVLYKAFFDVIFFEAKAPDMIAAFVAIICAISIYVVYRYNKKIALQINSSALMAAAKDNLSDAWVSIGTAFGITASQLKLPWLDPVAAIVVGILICKTGFDIFRESCHNLTDGFDKVLLDNITSSVKKVPGVLDVKDIKARLIGNNISVVVTTIMNGSLSVAEGHKITESIENKLKGEFNVEIVVVHIEPHL